MTNTQKTTQNTLSQKVAVLLANMEKSQYLKLEQLEKMQFLQLVQLAAYAAEHSTWFAKRFKESGIAANELTSLLALRKLPILTRRELQLNAAEIYCRKIPANHTPVAKVKTSGSSGQPVEVFRNLHTQLYWLAHGLREHLWHKRNFKGKLAAVRANLDGNKITVRADWGEPVSLLYQSGTAIAIPINMNVSDQLKILKEFDADYLLIYPNNLAAILDEMRLSKKKLGNLKQIRTIGETLSPALRSRVKKQLGVGIADMYSSQEVGNIAIECPVSGLYHIMAENLIVEVLDENGEQCSPGETGRVVVTDLINYATPLLRYDIGDYAEVGMRCSCGRNLQTLKRIMGRTRNMLIVNGEKRWPLVGFHDYCKVAPVVQYQLIQKTSELIEVRLVVEKALNKKQEKDLAKIINEALQHNFKLKFTYFEKQIPRSATGKFEEFICEI